MKKVFSLFVLLIGTFVVCSCNSANESHSVNTNTVNTNTYDSTINNNSTTDEHTHTFSNSWSFDNNYHWHNSTCGHDVVSNKENHDFEHEETKPTFVSEGFTKHICRVCGYNYIDNRVSSLDGSINWNASFPCQLKTTGGIYSTLQAKYTVNWVTLDVKYPTPSKAELLVSGNVTLDYVYNSQSNYDMKIEYSIFYKDNPYDAIASWDFTIGHTNDYSIGDSGNFSNKKFNFDYDISKEYLIKIKNLV